MEMVSRKAKSLGRKEKIAELNHLYTQYSQYDDHSLRLILANSTAKHDLRKGIVSVTTALMRVLMLPFAILLFSVVFSFELTMFSRTQAFAGDTIATAKLLTNTLIGLSPWFNVLTFCLAALIFLVYLLLLLGHLLNFYTKRRIRIIEYILEKRLSSNEPPAELHPEANEKSTLIL